jgi:hypothetical protein
MVKILGIVQSNVSGVFRLVLNLHYADILKSKSWLSKDIFDLQIKPKPIETELKPFIIAHYRKH